MIDRGFITTNGRATLRARSIVASFSWMAELFYLCDHVCLRCHKWPSCFVCMIDREFVAMDSRGLVALYTQSMHRYSIGRHTDMLSA